MRSFVDVLKLAHGGTLTANSIEEIKVLLNVDGLKRLFLDVVLGHDFVPGPVPVATSPNTSPLLSFEQFKTILRDLSKMQALYQQVEESEISKALLCLPTTISSVQSQSSKDYHRRYRPEKSRQLRIALVCNNTRAFCASSLSC